MPGRSNSTTAYRYAYNGMEKDAEVKGEGNSYTTEFRQYDPRLGRWLSLDPLMSQFPWMSPYVAFDNNPILFIDPYGLESSDWSEKQADKKANRMKSKGYKNVEVIQSIDSKQNLTGNYGVRSTGKTESGNVVFYFEKNKQISPRKIDISIVDVTIAGLSVLTNLGRSCDGLFNGNGDKNSGLSGGHKLVTNSGGKKNGPSIESQNGSSREVDGDLLGAGKGSQKSTNYGVYKDAGEKAKQMADAFKDLAKVKKIISPNSSSNQLQKLDADEVMYRVVRYNWSVEKGWDGKESLWSAPIDPTFEKFMTLNEIKSEYPEAKYDEQENVYIVNPSIPK